MVVNHVIVYFIQFLIYIFDKFCCAQERDYPYMIAFFNSTQYVCAGALVEDNAIVALARFFDPYVRGGSLATVEAIADKVTSKTSEAKYRQVRQISHVIIHPEFNISSGIHDICIIHLVGRFNLCDYVGIIKLTPFRPEPLDNATSVGWQGPCEEITTHPMWVLENQETRCKGQDSKTQLCAASHEPLRCGYSGAALVKKGILVGLLINTYTCGKTRDDESEALFIDISYYNQFIYTNLDPVESEGKKQFCSICANFILFFNILRSCSCLFRFQRFHNFNKLLLRYFFRVHSPWDGMATVVDCDHLDLIALNDNGLKQ
ncbi:serine protease ami-like [Hermetia illucens]|uniref:serine protease ami-like n=1 Tax=Hermetia illucens TaxID=343691 RepID=UPI0018CC23E3|nr:serine protease ami-like [Hermetia illucens]